MKQISAFIHPHRINMVTAALRDSGLCDICVGSGFYNLTVSNVQRLYSNHEPGQHYSVELAEPVVAEIKLELICEDKLAEQLAVLIANTAKPGPGWVFVGDMQTAIRIT